MESPSRYFAQADSPPRAAHQILVAEDHPGDGRFLATILAKAGYSVTLECNAQQVIDRVTRGAASRPPYDLVILDLSLNPDDVITTASRLRETDRCLPILAITPHESVSRRHDCLEAGCNVHLVKPLSREQLLYETGRLLLERTWPDRNRSHVHYLSASSLRSPFASSRNGVAAVDREEIEQATDCDV